jgi:calcineurin-like phosphoesterase family protein
MNEVEDNKLTEIDYLREFYIEDLSKIVTYGKNPRPRVAHPGKWAKLNSVVSLNESEQPMSLEGRKVWAWSDLHFWHKNIIQFSERPYTDLEEMHEHLLLNHNEYVGKDDVVIWGGDIGFKATGVINEMLAEYNGYKILIVGNHDFNGKKLRKLNFDETHLIYTVDYPDVSMVFTHYPMYNVPKPWVNIHGHLHAFPNPVSNHPRHININCEVQGYRPMELDEIAKRARMHAIADEI